MNTASQEKGTTIATIPLTAILVDEAFQTRVKLRAALVRDAGDSTLYFVFHHKGEPSLLPIPHKGKGASPMLDGKQQKKALLDNSPPEDAVQIRGPMAKFPGIAIAELSGDQKKLVENVMHELLAPYRAEDVKEAMGCLKSGGGLDKMHIAFYKNQDID